MTALLRTASRLGLALGLAALLPACDSDDPAVQDAFAEAEANPGAWTFVEVDGAVCRNGSPTGFGVRLQPGARDLVIYLEGGGACFNSLTCRLNPDRFARAEFDARLAQRGTEGLFSTAASNPVGRWNMVYVPYCTGDVHGGSAPNAAVPGVEGVQQFVGHRNVERYLDLLAPYFDDADRVLLAGESAGGFGTLVNFAEVADRFSGADLSLLNDSGPLFTDDLVLSPALQQGFISLWRFDLSLPSDAGALVQPDGLPGIHAYYAARYPGATFGLTSTLRDDTIRFFFGFGQPDGTITGEEYEAGLRGLRATLPEAWGTYFAPGEGHTLLGSTASYTGSVAGTTLNAWVGQLVNGQISDVEPGGPALVPGPTLAARSLNRAR